MRLFKRLSLLLLAVICLSVAVPVGTAHAAWNPFAQACQSQGAGDSAVCKDNSNSTANPLTGGNGIIMKIVNFIAFISGAVAVIFIIVAGLRFVTSGGSSESVAGARRTIIYAAVGLVVIVLARTLVAFVLGKI